ncbi:MAG: type II toxin-antitoxin system RelE/ParE family toxin [Dehalococcoidales bacterium]|nr:type II toxin-antitoxin system RelE/ParE family toxin [Dehalococcoidales bacterium]
MSYSVRFSASASARIRQLDNVIARRVLNRIKWLSENFETLSPEPLTGSYAGLYKVRIGSYRLVYSIDHEEKLLNIILFDHRKDVYRRR